MPTTYLFETPRVRGPHAHGTSDPSLGCAACRRESLAAYKASVSTWRTRESERLVRAQRPSRVRDAASWAFGLLILASPFWLLWSMAGGNVLPWLIALVASFLVSEEWFPEPAERQPDLTGFARDAWGLAFDAEMTSRSRHLNWEAEVVRRERARLLAQDRRAAAMREVAQRAAVDRGENKLPWD
jgi:hypothetical protein